MFCFNACPEQCIKAKKDDKGNIKREETDLDYCKGCGICEEVCPVKCIKMVKE
jgi:pyruvate ferredoxin oxidoreductase delta subunit